MRLEDALRAPRFWDATAYIKTANIPNLDAGKITTGTLSVAGIIDASTLIADNVVVTDHLVDNSATLLEVATAGSTTTSGSTYVDLVSVSITTIGKPVLIQASLDVTMSNLDSVWLDYQILRGSTVLKQGYMIAADTTSVHLTNMAMYSETPAAGSYTYKIQIRSPGTHNLTVTNSVLCVTELRK